MTDRTPRPSSARDVTGYFTGLAAEYDAHRPGYPPEAIAAAITGLDDPVHAADVGCGTGICARMLAAIGTDVVGIDPNGDMLERARRCGGAGERNPTYRKATAERTGLEPSSVSLVLCAQAFHWFESADALDEFHRILRPGGRLALMWNVRGETDPMSSGYAEVVRRAQAVSEKEGLVVPPHRSFGLAESALFSRIEVLTYDNPQILDRPGLLGRIRSASYFPREGPDRETLEAEILRLFDENERGGLITIAQRTELTRADVVK